MEKTEDIIRRLFDFQLPREEKPLSEETLEALADALEQIPERERKIIVLRFYGGYSAKETAEKVGISYANVRFLQYAVLKKLRKLLDKTGLLNETI